MAHKQNCSYVAVKAASAFVYKPTNDWKIPEPGDLFDKDNSMTEQHREEQRSTPEWLQEWSQIKVQPQSKRRGKYVPKRPHIASTAETTLQEGLWPCGYTALSKDAMMAVVARRSGRAPNVMRSVVAGPVCGGGTTANVGEATCAMSTATTNEWRLGREGRRGPSSRGLWYATGKSGMWPVRPAGSQCAPLMAPCSLCSDRLLSTYSARAVLELCSCLFLCAPEGARTLTTWSTHLALWPASLLAPVLIHRSVSSTASHPPLLPLVLPLQAFKELLVLRLSCFPLFLLLLSLYLSSYGVLLWVWPVCSYSAGNCVRLLRLHRTVCVRVPHEWVAHR